MEKDSKQNTNGRSQTTNAGDQVIYDEELGEENVELVDSEWADFERALRYTKNKIHNAFT